jgi:hypothetical protein
MSMKRALQVIVVISLIGVVFSGTLTFRELCGPGGGCAAAGSAGTILGLPACVYGLVMYALVGAVAALGLGGAAKT